MQQLDFLRGINVEGSDVQDFPEKIVEILNPTPISWIRVHLLPTRRLDEKGKNGMSYLRGIEYLCKNGYNILAPIDVGYASNVGTIYYDDLDKFVEESYDKSYAASKKISEIVKKYDQEIIFGIENEIDLKAWILQSLPGINWRAQFETWTKHALDYKLKYKRLNNILNGVHDANPDAKTMTNIVAEDLRVFFSNFRDNLGAFSPILDKYSLSIDDLVDNAIDWKKELLHIRDNLDVDYVGLDNYANWILKYPVYGNEVGMKVDESLKIIEKPIINAEFGYTTYRTFFGKFLFSLLRRPSASKLQLDFFQNSLQSIEKSSSVGTFPWVLFSYPHRPATPQQESYFGLIKINKEGLLQKEPAWEYYVKWLRNRLNQNT